MREDGFTLTELLIVIFIIAVLLTLATMGYSRMNANSFVERQTKELSVDLLSARSQAVFEKRGRTVVIGATQFTMYYSDDLVHPVQVKTLKQSVTPAALQLDFDQLGAITINGDSSITDAAVCAQVTNSAGADSITVSRSSIQIGKLRGGSCASGNIDIK